MGVGECGEILEPGESNGKNVLNKSYEQVFQKLIINRKLTISGNYIEATIKSVSTRSTNCRLWGKWRNMETYGDILATLAKQSKRLTLSINSQQG